MTEQIGAIVEPRMFEQLGILVLDGSGSMKNPGETNMAKAEEVNIAVRDLISRLKVSRYRDNFMLAIVTYDNNVNAERLAPTRVTELDESADYNPLAGHGDQTAIGDALAAAGRVAANFLAAQVDIPRSVVIVLMSDGQNNHGADPVQVADAIKSDQGRVTICAAGYGKGSDLDELTLKRLVTGPTGYKHTYNTEELREFFTASITQQRG